MKPIIQSRYNSLKCLNYDKHLLFQILKEESLRWSQNLYKWFCERDIEFIYREIYGDCIYSKTSPEISKIMFDFCNDASYCKICNKESKFFTFKEGYFQTCGNTDCYNELNSNLRIGCKNPSHRMTPETRKLSAIKQSEKMKQLILDGKFTPCITNSWANSRCKIKLDNCSYLFRSTWEAMFWLLNGFEYEKIRIPYKGIDRKTHIYIVDFVDESKKLLYEIKPSKLIDTEVNLIKYNSAVEWCKTNGYNIQIISEDYFKNNKNVLLKMTKNKKILKALKFL